MGSGNEVRKQPSLHVVFGISLNYSFILAVFANMPGVDNVFIVGPKKLREMPGNSTSRVGRRMAMDPEGTSRNMSRFVLRYHCIM